MTWCVNSAFKSSTKSCWNLLKSCQRTFRNIFANSLPPNVTCLSSCVADHSAKRCRAQAKVYFRLGHREMETENVLKKAEQIYLIFFSSHLIYQIPNFLQSLVFISNVFSVSMVCQVTRKRGIGRRLALPAASFVAWPTIWPRTDSVWADWNRWISRT